MSQLVFVYAMKVAKLLGAKRSQAVGIFVSSLHLQAGNIETGSRYCLLHGYGQLRIMYFLLVLQCFDTVG